MEREWRHRYASLLLQQIGSVSLPLGGPTAGERLELERVFQPLSLRQDPLTAEDLSREQRRPLLGEEDRPSQESPGWQVRESDRPEAERITAPSAHEALRQSRTGRMVVLGGPGTGKTTVLKDLAAAACRDVLRSDAAPLPVFIALPDLARGSGNGGMPDYLLDQIGRLGLPSELGLQLWDAVASGNALVCLDGLDEVAPGARAGLIDWIATRAPHLGGQWVIGSRFTSYKGGELGSESFTEWELSPLDEPLRLELAGRLLPVLRSSLGAPPVEPSEDARGLIAAVAAHPQARAWGENPLLLCLAAVAYVKNAGLPASRAALYSEVLGAVLATREPYAERQAELMQALGQVALRLFLLKGRTFTRSDLDQATADLDSSAPDLAERAIASGVLDVVAHEVYAFRHQTMQEYLAATALAADLSSGDEQRAIRAWDVMWSKRTFSRWTEVLRLVVGVLVRRHGEAGSREAERWLMALAGQADTALGDPGDLGLVLAVRSAAEVADAPDRWVDVDGIAVAAALIRRWLALFLTRSDSGMTTLHKTADDVRRLDPRAIAAGMDETLAMLSTSDSQRRCRALYALGLIPEFVPIEPLVAHWHALQSMPVQDDNWSTETEAVLEILGETGRRAPVDLLLAAMKVHREVAYSALANCASLGNPEGLVACRQLADLALVGLRDNDAGVRIRAVSVLERIGQKFGMLPAAIDPLAAALGDSNSSVRAVAAQALGRMRALTAERALVAMLSDAVTNVRDQAIRALGALGDPESVPALVKRLKVEENAALRAHIVIALAKIDPSTAVRHVATYLAQRDFLWDMCPALDSLGPRVPVDDLLRLADHHNEHVRTVLARTLARYGSAAPRQPLITLLADKSGNVRVAAATSIGATGDHAMIPYLCGALRDRSWQVRCAAALALTKLGEPGQTVPVADLIADFTVCDDDTVTIALRIAGEMKDGAPLDLLRHALTEQSVEVRAAATWVLGKIGGEDAAELLKDALRDDDDHIRESALAAFGNFEPSLMSISVFTELLRTDRDPRVRAAAARALRHAALAGGALPVAELVAALAHDPDAAVRIAAAQALGILGTNAPFEPLVAALSQDPEESVRANAAKALGAFTARIPVDTVLEAVQRIDMIGATGSFYVAALGAASDRVPLEVILAAESDPSCRWRPVAIEVLGYYGDRAPVDQLLALLDTSTAVHSNRNAARSALLRLGDRVPVERMLAYLKSKDFFQRKYASRALAALGEHAPVAKISAMLNEADRDVRAHALTCLCHLGHLVPDEIFISALQDPSELVRKLAANEIRARNLVAALPQLETAWRRAEKDRSMVRIELAYAWAALGDSRAASEVTDVLVEALLGPDEQDDSIRDTATEALIALSDRVPSDRVPLVELVALLGGTNHQASQAVRVLRATHPESLRSVLPEITSIVRERRAGEIIGSRMRIEMAKAIGQMQRVPQALLTVLGDLLDWPFAPVREAAASALGKIRRDIPDDIIRKLLAMRQGPDREAADAALAEILSLETGIEDD